MVEDIREVRKILDKLLINNDKHIVDIIISYSYPRCCRCDTIYNEEYYNLRYDNEPICYKCYVYFDWKMCNKCRKYFDRMINIYCRSCLGKCRVNCRNCLSIFDRIEYSSD